jgi:hypothetical protein
MSPGINMERALEEDFRNAILYRYWRRALSQRGRIDLEHLTQVLPLNTLDNGVVHNRV